MFALQTLKAYILGGEAFYMCVCVCGWAIKDKEMCGWVNKGKKGDLFITQLSSNSMTNGISQ